MRTDNAQLAWDTIERKPRREIPAWLINPMEWRMIDRLAGVAEGSYQSDPVPVYRRMLEQSSCCMVDQWLATNPLSMGSHGYESDRERGATTGTKSIVVDGMPIAEPEDVVAHMEKILLPRLQRDIAAFDETSDVAAMLAGHRAVQAEMGPAMLKAPYMDFASFPSFLYGLYGYECYFMAYALYPEIMERFFARQADLATLKNRAGARAIAEGNLPRYLRLDHDMADSRGMLVDIATLDRIWFPHFARCIQPFLDAGVTLIWHCDGNLSEMVPRLLECGVRGFQGFQYEDGMDYRRIAAMKDREGNDLLIIAGVSVTRTLPHGTPEDVRTEMKFLVENGPRTGLFLGASSSIAPGVPWENLKALQDGFAYYRQHGHAGGPSR